MNTIAIVDDHTLIAQALTRMVNQFQDFKVLYQVGHGLELQGKLKDRENIPDIVLLDINMPVMDGYETASWLKENNPDVRILVLSVQDEESSLLKIIRNGATGYLLKNVRLDELEWALQSMMKRGYYYPEWVAHSVITSMASGKSDSSDEISDREVEFLKYAATEMTYKEIADKMFCSPRTVEGYRDGLFEKFGVRTRVSLVVFSIKHHIITIE